MLWICYGFVVDLLWVCYGLIALYKMASADDMSNALQCVWRLQLLSCI